MEVAKQKKDGQTRSCQSSSDWEQIIKVKLNVVWES